MLTRDGGALLSFSRFCSAIRPPKVVFVLHEASTTAALGAPALAYSASRIASVSLPFTPGLAQLFLPLAGAGWICVNEPSVYVSRPNTVRKESQSAVV